ncbi:MAG: peptide chain release factor N(5)-glutamine methyltransferase [Firmicutes bacterium]|nr:peptide chain release factor N(5)-glutamine methyltransferase [Bacillota bacterium]
MAEPIGIITIKDALSEATQRLHEAGIESARLDGEVLLAYILKVKREYLYAHPERLLGFNEYEEYQAVLERRATRLPVSYITGSKEFMSLDYIVNEHVLIPRPETEILVEETVSRLEVLRRVHDPLIVVDIGTGSGAIAVAIAWFLEAVDVIGTDISCDALAVAKKNAEKHKVDDRIRFLQGDLLSPLNGKGLEHRITAIVSNPPYLSGRAMAEVPPEVAKEPKAALVGGEQGLNFLFVILEDAPRFLAPGGFVALEIGYDQAKTLTGFAKDVPGYTKVTTVPDLAGIERVLIANI